MRILYCPLHAFYFNEILQGRKKNEYRENTPFWRSRLFRRDGTPKTFDVVKFRNGYSHDAPVMIVEFKGFTEAECFDIALGEILETANIENLKVKPPPGGFQNPAETAQYTPGDLLYNFAQLEKVLEVEAKNQ